MVTEQRENVHQKLKHKAIGGISSKVYSEGKERF